MNEPDQEQTALAVAVGRIEEGIKNLNEKVDRVIKQGDEHASTLSRHDLRIAVLESKQGPRIHPITWGVGAVAIAAFVLGIFDRFYA